MPRHPGRLLAFLLLALARPLPAAEPTFRTDIGGDEDSAFEIALAGRTLVVGDSDSSRVWLRDARTGAARVTLTCPIADPYFGEVCGVSVAASRDRIAVGGTSFALVYDRAGRLLHELHGEYPGWARFGASVSLHGRRLLVGVPDAPGGGSAQLFDVATGEPLRTFANPDPSGAGFGRGLLRGRIAFITSGSPGGTRLSAFDVRTGTLLWSQIEAGGVPRMAAIGRDLVVLSSSGEVRRLRGGSGDTVQTYVVPGGTLPQRWSLAADGRTVAVGDPTFGEHGGVHLFDAVTGMLRETAETTQPASEALGWETVLDGVRLVTMSHPYSGDATLFGFHR